MKRLILSLAVISSLAACKKEADIAPVKTTPVATTTTTTTAASTTATTTTVNTDTIPDKAALKIQLITDATNYDETMIVFNHTSSSNYVFNEDAAYMQGFGEESLSSVSKDGKDMSINSLPYASGMAINLDFNTKADGAYSLKLCYQNKIPASIHVWVRDNFLKDSVDVSKGDYSFNVAKADANSYGNKRFQLVFKDAGTQATVNANGPN